MNQKNGIVNKLRTSGLGPTKQRILLAQKIYLSEIKHFIFTEEKLEKKLTKMEMKVSLATIYNTVQAFTKAVLKRDPN